MPSTVSVRPSYIRGSIDRCRASSSDKPRDLSTLLQRIHVFLWLAGALGCLHGFLPIFSCSNDLSLSFQLVASLLYATVDGRRCRQLSIIIPSPSTARIDDVRRRGSADRSFLKLLNWSSAKQHVFRFTTSAIRSPAPKRITIRCRFGNNVL